MAIREQLSQRGSTLAVLAALSLPLMGRGSDAAESEVAADAARPDRAPIEEVQGFPPGASIRAGSASGVDLTTVSFSPTVSKQLPSNGEQADRSRLAQRLDRLMVESFGTSPSRRERLAHFLEKVAIDSFPKSVGVIGGALSTAALLLYSRYTWIRRNFASIVTGYFMDEGGEQGPASVTFLETKIGTLFNNSAEGPRLAHKFGDLATEENPFVGFPRSSNSLLRCIASLGSPRRAPLAMGEADQMFAELDNSVSAQLGRQSFEAHTRGRGEAVITPDVLVALTNQWLDRKKLRVPVLPMTEALDYLENLPRVCKSFLDPAVSQTLRHRFITHLKLAVLAWCTDPTAFRNADYAYPEEHRTTDREWSRIAHTADQLRILFCFPPDEAERWLNGYIARPEGSQELPPAEIFTPREIPGVHPALQYFSTIRVGRILKSTATHPIQSRVEGNRNRWN